MIDNESEPGSWAEALRFPHSIRVLEDTRAPHTHSQRAEPAGAAVPNPDAAPDFS